MDLTPDTKTHGEEKQSEPTDWEIEEGIPQFEDRFIQKYLHGRNALIQEEKKQRHDAPFLKCMSASAKEACRIVSHIRDRELKSVWNRDAEDHLAKTEDTVLYPGMMFRLARDRMEETDLWKIVKKMPKGALLHGHLEAMVDLDLLVDQVISLPGMHIASGRPLTGANLHSAPLHFQYFSQPQNLGKCEGLGSGTMSIWSPAYKSQSYIPVKEAAAEFPDGGTTKFRDWLKGRCTIEKDVSLSHHHGCAAIWEILEQKFQVVDAILYYEPIFRACLKRMLAELNEDGIRYVEFRLAFGFVYRRDRREEPEPNFESMFEAFGEEIESFKASEAGQGFHGARMIWATMRSHTNRDIVESMKECIITKLQFPELICGFDLLGREDDGRPLVDMIPVLFWFKKQCAVEGVEIPFMFHAGECLGDGDETDSNLYDAILLGTRRIGHAFSLYKHPLLIDLVKEKKIMIECCPISNEVLRFTSSILSHPLPALLSRGVAVSLCNDDPAVLGHGRNGLTHDFCQVLNALENVGLSGLATMAENSLRWSCFEDQNNAAWLTGVKQGIAGTGRKTEYIRNWHIEFEKFCQWVILEFGSEAPESDGI
ncbi:putative adenosine deaminase [Microsporum canis]